MSDETAKSALERTLFVSPRRMRQFRELDVIEQNDKGHWILKVAPYCRVIETEKFDE